MDFNFHFAVLCLSLIHIYKGTLISESCAAKGVLPEQDTIILAGYLPDFRKML